MKVAGWSEEASDPCSPQRAPARPASFPASGSSKLVNDDGKLHPEFQFQTLFS
ncbi:hypothetical protein A2U01_0078148 [Trifolium medium]|uniref:Uncharacterized protein n=1 Tax=Trifolium medium TaxID=97028 RepID=A0A392T8X2_9FABA|nr:hypothetical protein [Trifolium medium]